MGKAKDLVPDLKPGSAPPIDPLFVTLFPNPDDGSVTVVEPPVMFELGPNHRQQVYASCITALEEMIQGLSPPFRESRTAKGLAGVQNAPLVLSIFRDIDKGSNPRQDYQACCTFSWEFRE